MITALSWDIFIWLFGKHLSYIKGACFKIIENEYFLYVRVVYDHFSTNITYLQKSENKIANLYLTCKQLEKI